MIFDLLKKIRGGLGNQPTPTIGRKIPERLEKLFVPELVWQKAIQYVSYGGFKGLEAAVIFYGYVSHFNEGIITTVVYPKQINKPGYYRITPESMSEVARSLIGPFRLLILAQMHIHPGIMTDMSPEDQKHAANCSILGGLQFILPYYGQKDTKKNLVVHEKTVNGWRRWDDLEKTSRLVFLPSSLDYSKVDSEGSSNEF